MPGRNTSCVTGLPPMRVGLGAKVPRLLYARDFRARRASVVGDQALAVPDLLWSGGFEMDVGEQIGIGLGQQESGEGRDLSIVKAVVRHRGLCVVTTRIVQPCLQPLGLYLAAYPRQLRAHIATNQIAGGILYCVA